MNRSLRTLWLLILLMVGLQAVAQHNFREKQVWLADTKKGHVLLLSPKVKIAHEKFLFFNKRVFHFKTGSRFQSRTITITGLDKNTGSYTASAAAVNSAICARGVFNWPVGAQASDGYQRTYKFLVESNGQLDIQLNMDALTKPALDGSDYEAFFHEFTKDLFENMTKLEVDHTWVRGISQVITEKIYENIPIEPAMALDRYLMQTKNQYSFMMLNPKIALKVDNVIKQRPNLPYSSPNSRQPQNDSFWAFDLAGSTIIRFYRSEKGALIQTPFLSPNAATQTNNLVDIPDGQTPRKPVPILQASSADIQLSTDLRKSRFIALYQARLKPNNQQAQKGQDNSNKFIEDDSQLWFFDKLEKSTVDNISGSDSLHLASGIWISSYGQRNLITPMVQIAVNKQPVMVELGNSIGLLKQKAILPDLKELCVRRLFSGAYRKIPHAQDDLLLLPGDQLTY